MPRCRHLRRLAVIALPGILTVCMPAIVSAQIGFGGGYGMYGEPQQVDLEELVRLPRYNKQAVRTQGVLGDINFTRGLLSLRDGSAEVLILSVEDAYHQVRMMIGREVEVVGVVRRVPERQSIHPVCGPDSKCEDPGLPALPDRADDPRIPEWSITIWGVTDITESIKKKQADLPLTRLEALVNSPGRRDDELMRVVGKFRGRNLYGDLPTRSQRMRGDWVIKDEAFAVWVTGKKPKGAGFDLDGSLKRDTGKWLEVIGRPVTRNGITYIKALRVNLSAPPTETAQALPPPPPVERPKVSPVIVFAMPLDGESEVPSDSRFVVQFNKDMDEATFKDRVRLRYAGTPLAGERPLNSVRLTYDGGRRALIVDPGVRLEPGRDVELVLLPGIADLEGLALTSRRQVAVDGAVDVLRFQIGL